MSHAASICHICAGNVDGAVAHWTKEALPPPHSQGGGARAPAAGGAQATQALQVSDRADGPPLATLSRL